MGDCDGSGAVSIDELIRMVNIALGVADLSACLAGDRNGDGTITIDELVAAVGDALTGCPAAASCAISFVPQIAEPGQRAALSWTGRGVTDCRLICNLPGAAAEVPIQGNIDVKVDEPVHCSMQCAAAAGGDPVGCNGSLPLATAGCPAPACRATVEGSSEEGYRLRVDTDGTTCSYSCNGIGAGAMPCDGAVDLGGEPRQCRVWVAGECGSVARCGAPAWSAPVTVDGSLDDWPDGTRFATVGGANYVSWDDEFLYFAVQHWALFGGGPGIAVNIYLGGPGTPGANRSLTAGSQSCTLPVPMAYAIRWRPASGELQFFHATPEGSWAPVQSRAGGGPVSVAADPSASTVEFAVPRSSLDLGDRLYVHIDMSNDGYGHESTFGATPATSHPDGYLGADGICSDALDAVTSDSAPPDTQPGTGFQNIDFLGTLTIQPPADPGNSLRLITFNSHYMNIPIGEPDMDGYISDLCWALAPTLPAAGAILSLPAIQMAGPLAAPLVVSIEAAFIIDPYDACKLAFHIAFGVVNDNLEEEAGGTVSHLERADELAKRILRQNPDVVVLNELFVEDVRDKLVGMLKGRYPYIVGRIEPPAQFVSPAEVLMDPVKISTPPYGTYYVQDSGLALFSRYPFDPLSKQGFLVPDDQLDLWWQGTKVSNATKKAVAFVPFIGQSLGEKCRAEDCDAGKSAGLVRIAKDSGHHFGVAFTHLQASYGADDEAGWGASMDIRKQQLADTRALIQGSLTPQEMTGQPLFMMGDLNIIGRFSDGSSFGSASWPDWDPAHEAWAHANTLNANELRDWDLTRQEWLYEFCGLRNGQPGDPCHNSNPQESYLDDPPASGFFACGTGTQQECSSTPLLVDTWAYDTSPHDVGRSNTEGAWHPTLDACTRPGYQCFADQSPGCTEQNDNPPYTRLKSTLCSGERLDYMLHNKAPRLCAQHIRLDWGLSGMPGTQPLSDHIPVAADFNLWWHHCRPPEAKVVDKSVLEQNDNTFTTGDPEEYQIKYPGSMQWFLIQEPGSYSIGVSSGFDFEVYADEDLSLPKPSYHEMETEWGTRYFLAKPPYYVRVFAIDEQTGQPDRQKTGPYSLTIHRHTCTTALDACVLPAGVSATEVWPDEHFSTWDPADPHYNDNPDALWFIFTTYADEQKKLPYLVFNYDSPYQLHYTFELAQYCEPYGPCTGPHQVVRNASSFTWGPELIQCTGDGCKYSNYDLRAEETALDAMPLYFPPGPQPPPSPQGTRYFLRILRDEPFDQDDTPCIAPPQCLPESKRSFLARYGSRLTFFYPDTLYLELSEDDFWWDDTDELWWSFPGGDVYIGEWSEGQTKPITDSVLTPGIVYTDHYRPTLISWSPPNETVPDDKVTLEIQGANYQCPDVNNRGLCVLPEDEITSEAASPGKWIHVRYGDEPTADDADYLSSLSFCLMHEYPDKKQNDPSVTLFPTVVDCYGWGK